MACLASDLAEARLFEPQDHLTHVKAPWAKALKVIFGSVGQKKKMSRAALTEPLRTPLAPVLAASCCAHGRNPNRHDVEEKAG